jgi:hypothetical protein
MRARPLLVQAQIDFADALLRDGGPSRRKRADALLREVAPIAADLQLAGQLRRIDSLARIIHEI